MPPVQPGVTYEPESSEQSPSALVCADTGHRRAFRLPAHGPGHRGGSRSRPSQDLPACLAAGIKFAGRAGQARTADSNGGNRRLASAIDSSAGRSHISPRLGICHAWKADDRRAISVQLATVNRGQSRVLRVSEVGCSAASSAVICPIPKLIVRVRYIPGSAPRSPDQCLRRSKHGLCPVSLTCDSTCYSLRWRRAWAT
jgi:hypothetical protein